MSDEKSFWTPPKIASVVVAGIAVVAAAHVDSNSYFHYFVYQLPGFQYLWELVVPPLIDPTLPHREAPSIVPKAFAVYSALYYLAYNKYMDRVRTIEGQANALITQITASMARDDNTPFQDLARVQHMWCYPKPTFGSPWSVWRCLRAKEPTDRDWRDTPIEECHWPVVEQLKGVVENHNKLQAVHLSFAWLKDAALTGANLEGAFLDNAQLQRAYLFGAHLQTANLLNARLDGAYLSGAHFEGANLFQANLHGAFIGTAYLDFAYYGIYIYEANLSKTNMKNIEDLSHKQILTVANCQDIIIDEEIIEVLVRDHKTQWSTCTTGWKNEKNYLAWCTWRLALLAARKEGRDIKPWWEWFEDYKTAHPETDWDEPEDSDTA